MWTQCSRPKTLDTPHLKHYVSHFLQIKLANQQAVFEIFQMSQLEILGDLKYPIRVELVAQLIG